MVTNGKNDKEHLEYAANLVREARYSQQISLEQAAKDLHIPIEQLEALEQGDVSSFAAEVYARGAYTQYAIYLGIDSQLAQRAILRSLSSVRVIAPLKVYTPARWFERIQHPRFFIIGLGLCASLLVGGYIVWQLRLFWQLPALAVTSPQESVIDADHIVVRGTSEKGIKLFVNGESFLLKEDNTFELDIDLHPGVNVIQLEGTNAAGRKRVVERHYLRPRPQGYL
ncbi:MAG: helix-turn-helix domain-containing protein [Candidatus Andersenbacteria bacterium]